MAMFRVSNSSPLALIRKAEGDNTDSDPKVENDIDPPKKKLKVEEDEEYSTDFGTKNADSKKVDELRSPEQDIQLERRMRKKRDDYGDGDTHQDDVEDEAKSGSESPNPVFVEREQLKFDYSGLEEEMPFPQKEYESEEYEWHVYTHKYDFAMPEESDSKKVDELRSPEQDIQLERRMRKKRDDYGDGDTHQDDVEDEAKSGSESPNPIFVEREQLEFNYSSGIEEMPPLPKEYEWLRHVY